MNAHDPNLAVPCNIEAEQALLGAILVNDRAYERVAPFLTPEHFHEQIHQVMFDKVEAMVRAGRSVNPVTLNTYMPPEWKGLKLDGEPATVMQYLARLAAEAVTVVNAVDYARTISDLWLRRHAVAAATDLIDDAYNVPPEEDFLQAAGSFEDKIARLRANLVAADGHRSAGQSYLDALSASYKRGEVRGVPLPLKEIGDVISEPCFEAGNLYGLLSSSGEGKTSLTVQMMLHALRKGHPVLFLSFDQSSDQVLRQMVAQEKDIEARRQRDAKLLSDGEFETCVDFANWIGGQPFDVIKCTGQTAPQLAGLARQFIKRRGNGKVPFVVVDHIRAITPENDKGDEGTKALRIGQILKSAAEQTEAPWLILNQRNSYGMRRDNPRPIAADLFGGEGAKAPFDAVFYLYRFLKFLEERKAIASTDSDWKKIDKVFPSAVRQDGQDIAELGAIKVRFGNPNIRERLMFEARFTRYASLQPPVDQEGLGL